MAKTFHSKSNNTQRKLFNFSKSIEKQSLVRQGSCCGICGKNGNIKSLTGHHVIAVRHGCPSQNDPNYAFLRSVDNCAMVCKTCHISKAHGGHWAYGVLAGPKAFPYSHGNDKNAHRKWVKLLTAKEKNVCLFWKISRRKN